MRLREIIVEGLFNTFDYHIPLNMEDQITIIHGPNGFGKTILLKMIYGLLNADFAIFRETPFEKFRLVFEDESYIEVSHKEEDAKNNDDEEMLTISYSEGGDDITKHEYTFFVPNNDYERVIIGSSLFARLEDANDIARKYAKLKKPDWYERIISSVENHFIETQRLLIKASKKENFYRIRIQGKKSEKSIPMIYAVNKYSQELVQEIRSTLSDYASISQQLDRDFPKRLVSQAKRSAHSLTSVDEIRKELDKLEEKRTRLQKVGLWDKATDADFQITQDVDEDSINVLSLYIEDVRDKLKVFDDLAKKVELFRKIINDKFSYKEMSISKEEGFSISSNKGDKLSPDDLSSGEQHALVLVYQMLFKIPSDALLLIDEPEISQHIVWQGQFLKDMGEIIKIKNFDVIVATHSPHIISDRWDLTVGLEDEDQEENEELLKED